MARFNGTSRRDIIRASNGADQVKGKGGNDLLKGKAGNDKVFGDGGNDRVFGDAGHDRVYGGSGHDRAYGGSGNDRVYGNSGKDKVYGNSGNDKVYGGSSNDRVYGNSGKDKVYGNSGNDRVYGNSGNDRVYGNGGNDKVYGGSGNDRVYGNSGNDKLYGQSGNDKIYGGSGNDTAYAGSGNDFIDGGTGIDTAVVSGDLLDYTNNFAEINAGVPTDLKLTHRVTGEVKTIKNVENLQFDDRVVRLDENNAPLADDIAIALDETSGIQTIDLLTESNAFDFEGRVLTVTAVAANGTVIGNFTLSGQSLDYDPTGLFAHLNIGETATESIDFTISDGIDTITRTVTFTIAGTIDNALPVGAPELQGSAVEGTPLIATTDAISDADGLGTFSFQWQSSDDGAVWSNIVGETAFSFTPGNSVVGQMLRIQVSYTDGAGRQETVISDPTAPVINVNDAPIGAPVLSSLAPIEDTELTVDTASILDADGLGALSFQWEVSLNGTIWNDIPGANASTFTPGDDHVGMMLRTRVSYTDANGTPETVLSDFTGPVVNINDLPIGELGLSSTSPAVGSVVVALTAPLRDADGLGSPLTYQWQSSPDGTAWTDIPGAFEAVFSPGPTESGHQLRVQVSYIDGNGTPETVTSAATAPVGNTNTAPTGGPLISSLAPIEDAALTVSTGGIVDSDGIGPLSHQWQASHDGINWTDIPGANASSFAPGDAESGQMLRVHVSYTDGGGTGETLISGATAPVINVNDAPAGADNTVTTLEDNGYVFTLADFGFPIQMMCRPTLCRP